MEQKPQKILVVDPDPNSLIYLEVNLLKFGYSVLTATSSDRGLQVADAQRPDMIIAAVEMEGIDGIEFCWRIRETSKVRDIPFVLMSNSDDQEMFINGYRSGVDAFVSKPISMRALIARIETLIWRFEQIKQTQSGPAPQTTLRNDGPKPRLALEGDLTTFSLIELLQFMNASKKSGTLIIQREGASGEVVIVEGEVSFAKLEEFKGEEAIYRIAGWDAGTFAFHPERTSETKNIDKPTMKLILDACSVLDMENFIFTRKQ